MLTAITKETLKEEILEYYNECWVKRFKQGHNPKSLAMHMGYFENNAMDNDEAKLAMNKFLSHKMGLTAASKLHIVDAGCGVGGSCIYLAKNFPGLKITGINIAENQVEWAKQQVKANNLNGEISFVISDYCQTPLADNTADFVYATESLCHCYDKQAFFDEAYRILKPGGKLIMLDYTLQIPENNLNADNALLLDKFKRGWAVKDYIFAPEKIAGNSGFSVLENVSIADKVLPGISKSYEKAAGVLAGSDADTINPVMEKHLQACVSLKHLIERKIIDYTFLYLQKPAA